MAGISLLSVLIMRNKELSFCKNSVVFVSGKIHWGGEKGINFQPNLNKSKTVSRIIPPATITYCRAVFNLVIFIISRTSNPPKITVGKIKFLREISKFPSHGASGNKREALKQNNHNKIIIAPKKTAVIISFFVCFFRMIK